MIKIIITFLSCVFLLFNTILIADENDGKLRVGLLAPFSGEYKNIGESLLLSTQLALDEIDDDNIIIVDISMVFNRNVSYKFSITNSGRSKCA